jgi:hypothetical protein
MEISFFPGRFGLSGKGIESRPVRRKVLKEGPTPVL